MKCATPVIVQKPRYPALTILEQLSVPQTFDDLVAQIEDRANCRMFHTVMGLPMAFMEVPVSTGTTDLVMRWVYEVLKVKMLGTRKQCEARLCEWTWKKMVRLRQQFAERYQDLDPLLVWRLRPEFEFFRKGGGHEESHCRVYMRFAIPGLDLALDSDFTNDGLKYKMITKEGVL